MGNSRCRFVAGFKPTPVVREDQPRTISWTCGTQPAHQSLFINVPDRVSSDRCLNPDPGKHPALPPRKKGLKKDIRAFLSLRPSRCRQTCASWDSMQSFMEGAPGNTQVPAQSMVSTMAAIPRRSISDFTSRLIPQPWAARRRADGSASERAPGLSLKRRAERGPALRSMPRHVDGARSMPGIRRRPEAPLPRQGRAAGSARPTPKADRRLRADLIPASFIVARDDTPTSPPGCHCATRTTSLPKFRPSSRPMNASGAASSPSTTSSR